MSIDKAWNAYIFRDGKTTVGGTRLVNELADGMIAFEPSRPTATTDVIDLLLRAGELECALCDADSPYAIVAESITDAVADYLVGGTCLRTADLSRRARSISMPAEVQLATPEGFAYYALHPLDFADLARGFQPRNGCVAVIGIRSIGTSLSSVVAADFRASGIHAERITVRPSGHPYDRETKVALRHEQWLGNMLAHGADFVVVDEGPGMSGSSFLSVGDALANLGVPRSHITFFCSRHPDPATLTAADAARRWPAYHALCTQPTRHLPPQAKHYVAGGIWRARVFPSEADWPPSWRQMERLKFLSEDGARMFAFEGFGRFGNTVHHRASQVAAAGFGPAPLSREEGFGVYPMISGRYLNPADVDTGVLTRLAEYCAFRAQNLRADGSHTADLETMLRFNTHEEFGLEIPASSTLRVERPVFADARMLPYKWISTDGAVLKIDSATHGDDHFFPGPTDIAWDLAGTIVEWNLSPEAAAFFVDCYRQRTGDNPNERLPNYLVAYSIFRTAYCKMASAATTGTPERERFLRHYTQYRDYAGRLLHASDSGSKVGTHAA